MSHRVAVIVRTKDRPYFLRRALADIADQTFTDAEVVVVNDGGDVAVVQKAVSQSGIASRTRVVDTEGARGRCAAANTGVREAEAPYIVLHDDDDRWHPDFLAKTTALLDVAPGDAGVMVATEIVYERELDGAWEEVGRAPFWEGMTDVTFLSLLEVNRAVPISFLYRRSLHDELGYYDEALDAVEDWEFYLRVTAAHPVAFVGGTPLAYWTQRPEARGSEANSMFALSGEHERDDRAVRDRALREWVARNGAGLPLYIALVEKRIREELQAHLLEVKRSLQEQRERTAREFFEHHPVWRRLRRLRRGNGEA